MTSSHLFSASAAAAVVLLVLPAKVQAQTMEGHTRAADKKEVYVSPGGADKKTLLEEPLPGVEGRQVTIDYYTMPPGWVGGKHYHTGPVYVYVLEGSFAIDEQGKARQTFRAGELYKEPIGAPMQARNLNASAPLKALVIQISAKGEPLMIKAD